MFARRQTDAKSGKAVNSQRKEKTANSKKGDNGSKALMTGWDLPFLPDENDIVAWMKREKNGDNKKKARMDEEVPEEHYRHVLGRCKTVQNQMEFERESLHERYRKNCQYSGLVSESVKARVSLPSKSAKVEEDKEEGEVKAPSRTLTYPRSCKSAEPPATPKVMGKSYMQGLGDDADLDTKFTPLPSRSHSVLDDTKLRAYGLTLPPDEKTARLLELAGKFIAKAESAQKNLKENLGDIQDEGYGSKGSSNDAEVLEDDTEGSKVAVHDAASVYTNLDSLVAEQVESMAGGDLESTTWEDGHPATKEDVQDVSTELLERSGVEPTPRTRMQHEAFRRDAVAKLIYSQRDKNIYERLPSRRGRNSGFRYAGKEQSRLMETSLSNITPGYLSMHQFANLSNFSHFSNYLPTTVASVPLDGGSQQTGQQQQQQQEQQEQQQPQQQHTHQHHQQQQHHQQALQQMYTYQKQEPQAPAESGHGPKMVSITRISLQDASTESHTGQTQIPYGAVENNGYIIHRDNLADVRRARRPSGKRSVSSTPKHSLSQTPVQNNVTENGASYGDHAQSPVSKAIAAMLGTTFPQARQIFPSALEIPHKIHGVVSAPNLQTFYTKNKTPSPLLIDKATEAVGSKDMLSDNKKVVLKYQNHKDFNSSNAFNNDDVSNKNGDVFNKNSDVFNKNCDVSFKTGDASPVPLDTSRTVDTTSQSIDKVSTTCFPVADLLPAVERSLRRKRFGGGVGKPQMLYRSQTSIEEPLNWRPNGGRTIAPPSTTSSYQDVDSSPYLASLEDLRTRPVRRFYSSGVPNGVTLLQTQKGVGLPAFRPHHALSPLQRAKEIVNRRLHGHITTLPDGTETVQVTSPQYQPTKMDRVNSASKPVLTSEQHSTLTQLGRIVNGTWRLL